MSPDHSLTPVISAATRPGESVNQDRYFISSNTVVVLDGASTPETTAHDGGWYADTLGRDLIQRAFEWKDTDLRDCLADAIETVTARAGFVPGESPSTTVTVFRWNENEAEALVLGDSPVVIDTFHGVEVVRDDRLANVAQDLRRRYGDYLRQGHGYDDRHTQHLRQLVEAERAARNRPGGYWIAEADPAAARHAIVRTWPVTELRAALIITDGTAQGVDLFGQPPTWNEALSIAHQRGLGTLLQHVHDLEAHDPDGQRWPRSKPHDDKTAVLVLLPEATR